MLYCIFSPAKQYPFCFPNIFFTIEHADNEESIHQITLRKLLFLYMKINTNEEMNIKNVHLESSLKCREFTAWMRVILHWRTKWKMNDSFILSRVGYWNSKLATQSVLKRRCSCLILLKDYYCLLVLEQRSCSSMIFTFFREKQMTFLRSIEINNDMSFYT